MEVIFAVGNIDKPIIKIKAGVKTCSFFFPPQSATQTAPPRSGEPNMAFPP